jgi:hypothetical protein
MTEEETVDPAKGHKLEAVAAVSPTCTEDGVVAHWKCSVCGALFAGSIFLASGRYLIVAVCAGVLLGSAIVLLQVSGDDLPGTGDTE